jgi:hypothetical protein
LARAAISRNRPHRGRGSPRPRTGRLPSRDSIRP